MSFNNDKPLQIRNSTVGLDENSVCVIFAHAAKVFAESVFEKYPIVQDSLYSSDFDKLLSIGDMGAGGEYE